MRGVRSSGQLCLAMACVVVACGQSPEQQETGAASRQLAGKRVTRPTREGSGGLNPAQKEALARLSQLSERPLEVQIWERAGTLSALELDVPGSGEGSDPVASAQAFLKENALLWKLETLDPLRSKLVKTSAQCTRVVFQLHAADDLPVLNAALAIDVTSEGMIHRVVGRLSGDPLPNPKWSGALLEDQSSVWTLVRERLGDSLIGLPAPTRIWIDRFFMDSGGHELEPALLFGPSAEGKEGTEEKEKTEGETSPSVVVTEAGRVGRTFSSAANAGLDKQGCSLALPGLALPKVVVDPLTQTPTHVDLRALGGIATQGTSPELRALDLLVKQPLVRMFGSLEPRAHLDNARVSSNARGETVVHFRQVAQGMPVEGGHLSVVLNAAGSGLEVLGRFAYRATFAQQPTLQLASVRKKVVPALISEVCGEDWGCRKREAAQPAEIALVVLSSELVSGTRLPTGAARLAWRIDVAGRRTYWDAEATDDGTLYDYPTERDFTYTITKDGVVEISNPGSAGVGNVTPGIMPDPDAVAVAALLDPDANNPIENFYSVYGWQSFDNAGGALPIFVGQSRLAAWRPALGTAPNMLLLGPGWTQADVIAHEITHGVTQFSAGFVNTGEAGGLGESYSDVIASVIFPDAGGSTWLMGEASPMGVMRDMNAPELTCINNPSIPACFPGWRHAAEIDPSCVVDKWEPECRPHRYAGIPNLAAVLISDGGANGSSHRGLGRQKLGELAFRSLTSGLFGPNDRLLQHAVVLGKVCDDLAAANRAGFTFADCDHVRASLLQVGLSAPADYGWFRFSEQPAGFKVDQDYFTGLHLFRGCTIASHTMTGTDRTRTSSVTGTSLGQLLLDFGVWGVRFAQRGADTDATARSYSLHVWSEWYESGQVDVRDDFIFPPGVGSRDECLSPPVPPGSPPYHLRTLYSTARITQWASFFNGERGDVSVNDMLVMPPGCTVRQVAGVEYHHGLPYGAQQDFIDHTEHGYTVSRSAADPAELTTQVHWWHTGISSVSVRVAYTIQEDDGVDCSVPGGTQPLF